MTWRDKYLSASFKGVAFFVESHDMSGGRRSVQHEYVQRDKPFAEDLGRKAKSFKIEGYVVGVEYFESRDALLTALDSEGPGELVHPYLGRKFVQAGEFSVRETTKDGGMAVFSMNFLEAGEAAFPASAVDNRTVLLEQTEDLIDKASAQLEKVFSVLDKPQFVTDSAVAKINQVADRINAVVNKVGNVQNKVAETNARVQALKDKAFSLVTTPRVMADQIVGALRGVQSSLNNARDQYDNIKGFLGFGRDDKPVPLNTATREQEKTNLDALNQLIQISSLGIATQSAVDITFESTEDAGNIRREIVENAEVQMEIETVDDEVFQALADTKAEVIKSIPPPGEQLPTIGEVTLLETKPSLVTTYDLYENPIYEADLIARNKIAHPGFVPGGKSLEVLQIDG